MRDMQSPHCVLDLPQGLLRVGYTYEASLSDTQTTSIGSFQFVGEEDVIPAPFERLFNQIQKGESTWTWISSSSF